MPPGCAEGLWIPPFDASSLLGQLDLQGSGCFAHSRQFCSSRALGRLGSCPFAIALLWVVLQAIDQVCGSHNVHFYHCIHLIVLCVVSHLSKYSLWRKNLGAPLGKVRFQTVFTRVLKVFTWLPSIGGRKCVDNPQYKTYQAEMQRDVTETFARGGLRDPHKTRRRTVPLKLTLFSGNRGT